MYDFSSCYFGHRKWDHYLHEGILFKLIVPHTRTYSTLVTPECTHESSKILPGTPLDIYVCMTRVASVEHWRVLLVFYCWCNVLLLVSTFLIIYKRVHCRKDVIWLAVSSAKAEASWSYGSNKPFLFY